MPFVIQCPHPSCRKYMLLEDETRGSTVACLLCKHSVNVEQILAANGAGSEPSQDVRTCPQCSSRMRVASTASRVRCPKCQTVF